MDVELVPDPGADDPAAAAVRAALAREQLDAAPEPPGLTGAWWMAGLASATDRRPADDAASQARPLTAGAPRRREGEAAGSMRGNDS